MQKIPTLFLRDPENMKLVTDVPNPECQWVFDGEGVATRKYDGTCVMLDNEGNWWARREVKPGKRPPENYQPISTDPNTGKTVGWEPIEQSAFAKYHAEALEAVPISTPGTYELCGPKINGNPERYDGHRLLAHGEARRFLIEDVSYEALRIAFLDPKAAGVEGVVWHHPDGRMAKLKVRDFRA